MIREDSLYIQLSEGIYRRSKYCAMAHESSLLTGFHVSLCAISVMRAHMCFLRSHRDVYSDPQHSFAFGVYLHCFSRSVSDTPEWFSIKLHSVIRNAAVRGYDYISRGATSNFVLWLGAKEHLREFAWKARQITDLRRQEANIYFGIWPYYMHYFRDTMAQATFLNGPSWSRLHHNVL